MAWIVVETDSASNNLNESQAENNCIEADATLRGELSWNINAVSAVCGNMWVESHINPGCWQYGHFEDWNYGYGLGQWTPATKLKNWAESRGLPYRGNGPTQLKMLDEQSKQWHSSTYPYPTGPNPPISWEEFKKSDLPVEILTEYFLYYWEDPHEYAEISRAERVEHAEKYYQILSGIVPPKPRNKKGMPWIYWLPNQYY